MGISAFFHDSAACILRDAMKKPIKVAGIRKEDMKPPKMLSWFENLMLVLIIDIFYIKNTDRTKD